MLKIFKKMQRMRRELQKKNKMIKSVYVAVTEEGGGLCVQKKEIEKWKASTKYGLVHKKICGVLKRDKKVHVRFPSHILRRKVMPACKEWCQRRGMCIVEEDAGKKRVLIVVCGKNKVFI